MRSTAALALVCLATAFVAGCSPTTADTASNPSFRGDWTLVNATDSRGDLSLTDSNITLSVGTLARASGKGPCNIYVATIIGDTQTLFVRTATVWTAQCPDHTKNELESRYLDALSEATSATLTPGDLVLHGPRVRLEFATGVPDNTAIALVGTIWTLRAISIRGGAVELVAPAGGMATLTLGDTQFDGSTGCRTFAGKYIRDGGQITIRARTASYAACSSAMALQERRVFSVLEGNVLFGVTGNELTLTNEKANMSLIYRPEP